MVSDWLMRLSGWCLIGFLVCTFVSVHPVFGVRPNVVGRPYHIFGQSALVDLFSVDRGRATTLQAWSMIMIRRGLAIGVPSFFILAGIFHRS